MNKAAAAFLLAAMLLAGAQAMARPPVPALAQTLLDRAAEAWEMKDVPNYETLTDEILDSLALNFALNARVRLLNRHDSPEAFQGAGPEFDCALPRTEAAEIAAWYLGRRAPLKGVQGKYVYGMAADGSRMCQARLERIEPQGQGSLLKGILLCFENSGDAEPRPAGSIEATIVPEAESPSGYAVARLRAVRRQQAPLRDIAGLQE